MSIASRITSMENNIRNAYHSLDSIGIDTSNTNKNIENISELLDNFYDSLPKVSGTGTSISLSPTKKGRLGSVINGDTFQQTYTGKNLISADDITVPASTNFNRSLGTIYLEAGETYYYSYTLENNLTSATRNTPFFQISGQNTYQSTSTNYNLTAGRKVWEYTPQTSGTYSFGYWCHTPNTDLTISDFMISTSSDTTYEPYVGGQPSPSPDYPQEIKSVTGLQEINVCGKNLFDKNNANVLNAYINNSVIISSSKERMLAIKCQPSTTYTFTKLTNSPYSRNYVAETNVLPQVGVSYSNGKNLSSSDSTYTTTGTAKYIIWIFYNTDSTNYTLQEILDSIQIEVGSTATTYEPYQSQTKKLNLGKNLYNGTKSNIYFNASKQFQNQSSASTTNYIPAEEGDTFTISVGETSSGIVIASFDANYNCITRSAINTQSAGVRYLTYTCPANTKYIIGSNYNGLQTGMNTQLEKGSQITSYSPYFTPIHLRKSKDGTYSDYIQGLPNNWSIKRQIGSVVLDGTEDWHNYSTATTNRFYLYITDNIIPDYGLCDYFTLGEFANRDNQNYNLRFFVGITSNKSAIQFRYDSITTLANFKTWLSSNNVKVDYVLANETTETITNTELISQLNALYYANSYNGTTNISVDGDLQMILDVSTLKGEE